MTLNKLASLIAKREGLKKQVTIGNIREILAILSDVYFDNQCEAGECLYEAGLRRQLKREKSAKRPKRKSKASKL